MTWIVVHWGQQGIISNPRDIQADGRWYLEDSSTRSAGKNVLFITRTISPTRRPCHWTGPHWPSRKVSIIRWLISSSARCRFCGVTPNEYRQILRQNQPYAHKVLDNLLDRTDRQDKDQRHQRGVTSSWRHIWNLLQQRDQQKETIRIASKLLKQERRQETDEAAKYEQWNKSSSVYLEFENLLILGCRYVVVAKLLWLRLVEEYDPFFHIVQCNARRSRVVIIWNVKKID